MVRKLVTMAAVAAMAFGPIAAQAAAPLSLAQSSDVRVGAALTDSNGLGGDSTPVVIGLILAIILAAIVVSDGRDEPSNSP